MTLLPGMVYAKSDDKRAVAHNMYIRKKWLRARRELLNLSQMDMARKLEVTVSEYTAFENGKTECVGDYDFKEVYDFLTYQTRAKNVHGSTVWKMDRFEDR